MGGVAYTWDNKGNLISDGTHVYTYNQANRLTAITAPGLAWSATYNGDGARLQQTVNGVATNYAQDLAAPLPVVLQARTGSAATQYLFGTGTRPLAQYNGSAWAYLLPDGLGSVRQEIGPTGNVLAARSFDPFGVPLEGKGGTPFGYAGEQLDASTGLVFLRARYYDPQVGRFLSRDPFPGLAMLPSTQHAYAYGLNNPLKYVDPTGHVSECSIYAGGGCGGGRPIFDYAPSDALDNVAAGTELVAGVLFDPVDWAIAGRDCLAGSCSGWVIAAAILPVVSTRMVKYAGDAVAVIRAVEAGYLDDLIGAVGGCQYTDEIIHFLKTGEGDIDVIKAYLESRGIKVEIDPNLPDFEHYLANDKLILRDPDDKGALGHGLIHFLSDEARGGQMPNKGLGETVDELIAYHWQHSHLGKWGYSRIRGGQVKDGLRRNRTMLEEILEKLGSDASRE